MNMKTYKKFIKESVLDPLQDKLSSDIWDRDNKMKNSVKKQIVDIYEKFAKSIKLTLEPTEMILVGSMTGYNYDEESDLDIHVQFDTKDKGKIKRLRDVSPSGEFLKGTKHPINYYFMYKDEQPESRYKGIYDIWNDKWIKKDRKKETDTLEFWESAMTQAISWARKFMLDIDELRRDMMEINIYQHFLELEDSKADKEKIKKQIESKKQEIKADYDILVMNLHVLRAFRSEPYNTGEKFDSQTFPKDVPEDAEYSLNNVVFKILEKFKYWEMAKKMKEKCEEEFPELIVEK